MSANDPWNRLKNYTNARIALGHSGVSIPTKELLDFRMAHALAVDAVALELDCDAMKKKIDAIAGDAVLIESRAATKEIYLQHPDYGRRLNAEAADTVRAYAATFAHPPVLSICVADGLSSLAVERNAADFLAHFLPLVADLSPHAVFLARHARVALSDELGELSGAAVSIILIGERPGLSSPDCLSMYLTHAPRTGNTDEKRNCVSNIRPEGFPLHDAAVKTEWLVRQSLARGYSGVNLKDEQDASYIPLLARDGKEGKLIR